MWDCLGVTAQDLDLGCSDSGFLGAGSRALGLKSQWKLTP